ncbi:MAG: GntR family transcriptional regulator [Spirochaetales bacterium]|nr:GntR family transcriptional regulator [Spirochaetales bacterium]
MASSKNLKAVAYNSLKSRILSNEIPQGSYLEEKALCESMNMSRTPIREAINQLIQEDLVNSIQNKGIFVTEISLVKAREIFEMRHIIEPLVLKSGFDSLDRDRLKAFMSESALQLEQNNFPELHKIDYEFHSYISSCCRNSIMKKVADSLADQFQRIRTLPFYSEERTRNGVQEHFKLIELILQNKKEEAVAFLDKHISNTEHYFFMSVITQTN